MENKGYSLFELLITVAAIVIFVTLTVPKFSFVNKFVLQNEVDKLYVTLSYLQKKAMALNKQQELYFDLINNVYSYTSINNSFKKYKLPQVVEFGILPGVLGPPSKPHKVIKNPITFEKLDNNLHVIKFYPDGIISSGSVFFVDKDKRFLLSLSCPLSPYSCVRKYEYKDKKWVLLS
jgi:competence protein ComGC